MQDTSRHDEHAETSGRLARFTYARTPIAETPADRDMALRTMLRDYARGTHPLHGFCRAWAHLRHDMDMKVNKKKVHRLRKEEGLQVRIYHPRKRRRKFVPTDRSVCAEDGAGYGVPVRFLKIASMIDEHTRQALLNIVERSITAQRLTDELDKMFELWFNR
ncbi:IS3 family transposase [Rhodococcus wratislaviensis]|uniref:Uncharacterized protein n=1 Tax=Rhodococcus wratislaviensis NBRC 100605 TaxID=1219028 RepID=X0PZ05_RHOWR|nr:IS3 family transposase [Rhodococcus wratislaviensis]GAF48884.1 hypothetical protein RW1_062_00080 [Rhodococcus wratislaviensis NBRC 100605]